MKLHAFLLSFITLFLLSSVSIAQSDNDFTSDDSVFFLKNTDNMKSWLERHGIDSILESIHIQKESNYVILYLKGDSPKKWLNFRDSLQRQQDISLEESIFDAFAFKMQVGRDSALLYINFHDTIPYKIRAGLDPDKEFQFVIEEENKPMGYIGGIPFDLSHTAFINKKDTTIQGSIQVIKSKIVSFLEKEYKRREGWFWSAETEEVYRNTHYNTAYVKVANIKNEIIDDCPSLLCPYEELDVRVTISVLTNNKLLITCFVQGAYGGVLFKPRRGEYTDMEEEYKEYLKNYVEKITNKLFKYLKQG